MDVAIAQTSAKGERAKAAAVDAYAEQARAEQEQVMDAAVVAALAENTRKLQQEKEDALAAAREQADQGQGSAIAAAVKEAVQRTTVTTQQELETLHAEHIARIRKKNKASLQEALAATLRQANENKRKQLAAVEATHASEVQVLASQFKLKQASTLRTLETNQRTIDTTREELTAQMEAAAQARQSNQERERVLEAKLSKVSAERNAAVEELRTQSNYVKHMHAALAIQKFMRAKQHRDVLKQAAKHLRSVATTHRRKAETEHAMAESAVEKLTIAIQDGAVHAARAQKFEEELQDALNNALPAARTLSANLSQELEEERQKLETAKQQAEVTLAAAAEEHAQQTAKASEVVDKRIALQMAESAQLRQTIGVEEAQCKSLAEEAAAQRARTTQELEGRDVRAAELAAKHAAELVSQANEAAARYTREHEHAVWSLEAAHAEADAVQRAHYAEENEKLMKYGAAQQAALVEEARQAAETARQARVAAVITAEAEAAAEAHKRATEIHTKSKEAALASLRSELELQTAHTLEEEESRQMEKLRHTVQQAQARLQAVQDAHDTAMSEQLMRTEEHKQNSETYRQELRTLAKTKTQALQEQEAANWSEKQAMKVAAREAEHKWKREMLEQREAHDTALREKEAQSWSEKHAQKKKFAAQIKELEAAWETQLQEKANALNEAQVRLTRELSSADARHQQELETERAQWALLEENTYKLGVVALKAKADKLSNELSDLRVKQSTARTAHNREVAELIHVQESIEREAKEMVETERAIAAELRSEHASYRTETARAHTQAIEAQSSSLTSIHAASLQRVESRVEILAGELHEAERQAHDDKIAMRIDNKAALKRHGEKVLADAKAAAAVEMQAAEHKQELAHEQQLSRVRMLHSETMADLQATSSSATKALLEETALAAQAATTALREAHAKTLAEIDTEHAIALARAVATAAESAAQATMDAVTQSVAERDIVHAKAQADAVAVAIAETESAAVANTVKAITAAKAAQHQERESIKVAAAAEVEAHRERLQEAHEQRAASLDKQEQKVTAEILKLQQSQKSLSTVALHSKIEKLTLELDQWQVRLKYLRHILKLV